VLAGLAEHRDHQVGGAVDDLRLVREVGRAGDEAAQPDDARDAVEIAAARRLELGQDIDGAQPRGLLPVLDGELGAELAEELPLAAFERDLAGDEDLLARHDPRHVVARRGRRFRQHDAEFLEA